MGKPKLIVFDLDYTLWPFWVDTHVSPPFQRLENGKIIDKWGHEVKPCDGVTEMLQRLKKEGYALAVASRTGEVQAANDLIKLFGWKDLFQYKQIYPENKTVHFKYFQQECGLPYHEMLFFDDEFRNIKDVSEVGVRCVYVEKEAMSEEYLRQGLALFK